MVVGMIPILVTPEPARPPDQPPESRSGPAADRVPEWLTTAAIQPFADFMTRPGWAAILAFVILYKFGDALAGVIANPFYVAMGFTKVEIASISKVFGFGATLAGVAAGGAVAYRLGFYRSLFICGLLQIPSNFIFVLQAWGGHDSLLLTVPLFSDNFTGRVGFAS